jgi:hypothetical protein
MLWLAIISSYTCQRVLADAVKVKIESNVRLSPVLFEMPN